MCLSTKSDDGLKKTGTVSSKQCSKLERRGLSFRGFTLAEPLSEYLQTFSDVLIEQD